ncbi:MAG: hypothetical protein FWF15_12085, partial [Oscillospiraceae bacterium]|nr:hypothetical protein [Oscillospiraceae bacterium]
LESDLLAQWWGERFARLPEDPDVVTPDVYKKFAAERIASAAADAWNNRKPGGIAAAFGRVAVPHCRRVRYKDGSAKMYGSTNTPDFLRIEGGADTGVEYIAAFDEAGTMTGVVINLACTAQILEHQYYITADMWGELRRQWPECGYILPLCGASGDITMRDMVRRGRNEEIMNTVKGMEQQVGRILRESKYVLSELTKADIQYDAPVKHISGNIPLPIRTVTEDEYIAAKAVYDGIENWLQTEQPESEDSISIPMAERTKYAIAAGVVNRYKLQSERSTIDMELHALRIGDTVIVTNPFELFQDFGMCIKARSPANQTLVTQLSCGYLGYLPTEYSVPGGGYSAGVYNGYIGPDGGDVMVEKTLEFINRLF